ncbi:MAG: hypothetical protein GX665_12780 [Gammaproteobacteria bacterium]|nr:hypothetical protein [Gammaproteobacteria bacterium]
MEITSSYLKSLPDLNRQVREQSGQNEQTAVLTKTEAKAIPFNPDRATLENIEHQQEHSPTGIVMWTIKSNPNEAEDALRIGQSLYPALNLIKKEYERMHTELEKYNPTLAAKDFGFTLSPTGELMVLERYSPLTQQETDYLNSWLNSSSDLKNLSKKSAELMMEHVKISNPFSIDGRNGNTTELIWNGGGTRGLGGYKLDMSNFHSTIDFHKAVDPFDKEVSSVFAGSAANVAFGGINSNYWINQVLSKGEWRDVNEFMSRQEL